MKVSRGFSISAMTIVFGIAFSKSAFCFVQSAAFFCACDVIRRLRLAEEFLQLRLLLRRALVRGNRGDGERSAPPPSCATSSARQRAAVDAEIIDAPGERRARRAAASDAERLRRLDRVGERVDLRRSSSRAAPLTYIFTPAALPEPS